jgi:hypothetical protein
VVHVLDPAATVIGNKEKAAKLCSLVCIYTEDGAKVTWHSMFNMLLLVSRGRDSVVGIATRYGWTVGGSNPSGGEIFRTRPDRSWGPPSLLYNRHWVSFPGVTRSGRGVNHPPPFRVEVKERVELYLYSPSGSLRPVTRWTLPSVIFSCQVTFAPSCTYISIFRIWKADDTLNVLNMKYKVFPVLLSYFYSEPDLFF